MPHQFATHKPLGDSSPDIVLEASNGAIFFAHADILRMVSPVLASQIEAANLSNDVVTYHDRTVIPVPVPSRALERFLILCYPQGLIPPPVDAFDSIIDAHKVAVRLEAASVRHAISYVLNDQMRVDPYKTHLVAAHLRYPDIAAAAALLVLKKPLLSPYLTIQSSDPLYSQIYHTTFLTLVEYVRECSNAAAAAVRSFMSADFCDQVEKDHVMLGGEPWWLQEGHIAGCGAREIGDPEDGDGVLMLPSRWLSTHLAHVEAVVRNTPTGEAAYKSVAEWSIYISDVGRCSLCTTACTFYVSGFAERVRTAVDEAVGDVTDRYTFVKEAGKK